jgi:hypothetical protein
MVFVTVALSSDEWLRIQQKTSRMWPDEVLSRAEIMRRLSLVALDAVGQLSADEQRKLTKELRRSLDPDDHVAVHGRLPRA